MPRARAFRPSHGSSPKQASRPRHARTVADLQLQSMVTCPECRHQATEMMPTTACQFFYACPCCGSVLRPKPGECCVFLSYGQVPGSANQARTADRMGNCGNIAD